MPTIDKVYPSLFESEEVQKQQNQLKQELSIQRFKQFALTYNSKYKEVAKNTDE
jgi:hypothetical protein